VGAASPPRLMALPIRAGDGAPAKINSLQVCFASVYSGLRFYRLGDAQRTGLGMIVTEFVPGIIEGLGT
jgi:hypothetical protein